MKSLFTLVSLSAVAGLLVLAPATLAQSPTVDVYGGAPGGTQTQVGGVNAQQPPPPSSPPTVSVAGVNATRPSARAATTSAAATTSTATPTSSAAPVASAAQQTSTPSASTLAFTGLDLGVLLGAGALLLIVGVTLRRATRGESATP